MTAENRAPDLMAALEASVNAAKEARGATVEEVQAWADRVPSGTPPTPDRFRATWLLQSDLHLLNTWGRQVRTMFGGEMPYLVGSALQRADYRDVDVRLIVLDDALHDQLAAVVSLPLLNLAVSLWGQKVTGLPIDFQVQSQAEANDDPANKGKSRNPIGMSEQ